MTRINKRLNYHLNHLARTPARPRPYGLDLGALWADGVDIERIWKTAQGWTAQVKHFGMVKRVRLHLSNADVTALETVIGQVVTHGMHFPAHVELYAKRYTPHLIGLRGIEYRNTYYPIPLPPPALPPLAQQQVILDMLRYDARLQKVALEAEAHHDHFGNPSVIFKVRSEAQRTQVMEAIRQCYTVTIALHVVVMGIKPFYGTFQKQVKGIAS